MNTNLVFSVIDNVMLNEDDRMKAKLKVIELQPEIEAQSEDKFISRARPAFLYLMYAVFGFCIIGGVLGIWFESEMLRSANVMGVLFRAIPEEAYTLFGALYLGYSASRSVDKRTMQKAKQNQTFRL